MKYVFFGTPDFAAIILEKLIRSRMTPSVLVCNPDRPVGRKKIVTPPPTKTLAEKHRIPIWQPERLDFSEAKEKFSGLDFALVATYAKIIPKEIIELFRLGIVGIHFSILPKYRGASPVQSAILAGDERIATTFSLMDEKLDHGPILFQQEVAIKKDETRTELDNRLAALSGELLVDTLPKFVSGEIEPEPQNHRDATYTKKFSSGDGYIDPKDLDEAQSGNIVMATQIYRKIRALNPEPGVYTFIKKTRTKLLKAEINGDSLELTRIQRAGKNPTDYRS